MPRDPITDYRGELARLKSKTAVFPRRNPKRVLIQTNLSAVIAGIKAAVDSGLRKEIKLRAELRIQKQREARIEKRVDVAVNETGRGLFEVINFQIERAAQSCAQIVLKRRDRERGIEPVERVIDIEGARRAGKDAQAESAQFHATALTPSAAGKRTSNSVQSFSERTRRKSPPCSRASSRAKFKPIP